MSEIAWGDGSEVVEASEISPYIVSYKEKVREQDVMEIVEIIKWLLTEVESDQRKRVKAGEPSIS
jgi:hypothetical protein